MAQYGFYFNGDRCIGCRACQVACKDKNDLEVGILFRQVKSYETGAFPTPGYFHHSSTCNHCADPACLKVCPAAAISQDENGVVILDGEKCIGNQACIDECPYQVPQWLADEGIAAKCDLCADLRAKGETPACVEACPQRVLEWGDIEELKAKYPHAVMDMPILPDSSQTSPSYLITPRAAGLEKGFRQKII